MSREQKQQWARIGCGNVGKEGKNGSINRDCGVCGVEEESLEHIWQCEKARKEIMKNWVLVETLKGEIVGEMFKYLIVTAFNNLTKSGIGVRSREGDSEEEPSQRWQQGQY